MASPTKVRKRQWGKCRESEKVLILENMDLEIPDPIDKGTGGKKRDEEGDKSSEKGLDLQHPEMLSNQSLTEILTKYRIPIPVYSDGLPSRERLLYLFRIHVQPRPQRLRLMRRKKRLRTPPKEPSDLTSMEWLDGGGDETDVTNKWEDIKFNRKRTPSAEEVVDLPATKKQLIEPASSPDATTIARGASSLTIEPQTKVKRLLKRPGSSVNTSLKNKASKTTI